MKDQEAPSTSYHKRKKGVKKRGREGESTDAGASLPDDGMHTNASSFGSASAATPSVGQRTSHIKNKMVRSQQYHKLKHEKNKEKKKLRLKKQKDVAKLVAQGLPVPAKPVPHTIDNQRIKDETFIDKDAAQSEKIINEEKDDEFADHFANLRPPNVLITTGYSCSKIMYRFLSEMLEVFPAATYYKRKGYSLKKIIEYARNRDFTDLVVFNEDRKQINGMIVVHLPDGPTAFFRLSSLVLSSDIKGHGRATSHKPELVLNNFSTMLGHRVGRMFASLFCQDPNFKGRRVITFHNQRDFVFFRHHRYIFEEKDQKKVEKGSDGKVKKSVERSVKARLQECGPRFTLRLEMLQKGVMDTKHGEFEWVHKSEMDTGRTVFHL
jgi:ribosome production factor 1